MVLLALHSLLMGDWWQLAHWIRLFESGTLRLAISLTGLKDMANLFTGTSDDMI